MSDCTVYIDEAGDLGIRRGTRWFVLSAVIVDKKDEQKIRNKIAQIKARINVNEIHFRKIPDFNKRGVIVRELSSENFTYMNILVDTVKFDQTRIPSPIIAYNYICKYLLQRVSWYLQAAGRVADIMLSARGTARDGELIQYIQDKLLPYPNNDIDKSVFSKISARSAATWDLLQLADVCATTMFLTYEINGYGFSVPCYSMALEKHLYRKDGRVNSYGIKFFACDMEPDVNELKASRICAKKERTPGTTTT